MFPVRVASRVYAESTYSTTILPRFCPGLVALNYQTEDKANLFNRARFLDNGGCGFVLKPNFLRNVEDFEYSPLSPAGLLTPKWTVKIQVVSGQHIPKPSLSGEVIDPYVKVRIRGHPDDAGNKAKTEHVQNNGFNPVWAENFVFNVYVPQLAFLEFKVKDHSSTGSDKDIGSFCAPLTMLREGKKGRATFDSPRNTLNCHSRLSPSPP